MPLGQRGGDNDSRYAGLSVVSIPHGLQSELELCRAAGFDFITLPLVSPLSAPYLFHERVNAENQRYMRMLTFSCTPCVV